MAVVVKGVLLFLVEAPGATSVAFHNKMVLMLMLVLSCNIKAVLQDSKGAWSSRGDACLGPEEVTCLLQCELVKHDVGEATPLHLCYSCSGERCRHWLRWCTVPGVGEEAGANVSLMRVLVSLVLPGSWLLMHSCVLLLLWVCQWWREWSAPHTEGRNGVNTHHLILISSF